ncbi:MAG: hypothetical protein ACK5N8_01460 [Alphaproteobacteria bacterium]
MKKIFLAVFALFLISSQICHAEQFVEGMEDIPLMKGLKQIVNSDIAFGNEETRFLEVYLEGEKNVDFQKVQKFYLNTLPELGWKFNGKKKETLSFYRDGELVEVAKEKKSPLLVRITLRSEN